MNNLKFPHKIIVDSKNLQTLCVEKPHTYNYYSHLTSINIYAFQFFKQVHKIRMAKKNNVNEGKVLRYKYEVQFSCNVPELYSEVACRIQNNKKRIFTKSKKFCSTKSRSNILLKSTGRRLQQNSTRR